MKVCEVCGAEIETKDGENRCEECEMLLGSPRSMIRTDAQRLAARRKARRERDQAMRDCGLVKVRGALGGTYWE